MAKTRVNGRIARVAIEQGFNVTFTSKPGWPLEVEIDEDDAELIRGVAEAEDKAIGDLAARIWRIEKVLFPTEGPELPEQIQLPEPLPAKEKKRRTGHAGQMWMRRLGVGTHGASLGAVVVLMARNASDTGWTVRGVGPAGTRVRKQIEDETLRERWTPIYPDET